MILKTPLCKYMQFSLILFYAAYRIQPTTLPTSFLIAGEGEGDKGIHSGENRVKEFETWTGRVTDRHTAGSRNNFFPVKRLNFPIKANTGLNLALTEEAGSSKIHRWSQQMDIVLHCFFLLYVYMLWIFVNLNNVGNRSDFLS